MNLLDKVRFVCGIANQQTYSKNEMEEICELTKEHSEHYRLGKVFGYSVSDFAIACLNWIGCNDEFNERYNSISAERREKIDKLIESKIYKQLN